MRPSAGLLCLLLLAVIVDASRADDTQSPASDVAAPNPVHERGRAIYEAAVHQLSRCKWYRHKRSPESDIW